mgnify:CR=1 FL=1
MTVARETLPRADLAPALAQADLRVLLMVVFHLTGDRRWLAPPFTPKRDAKLIADEDAGLAPEAAAELRAAALDLLAGPPEPPAVAAPDEALMGEMMAACLGHPVEPDYAPMMREELGFAPRPPAWPEGARPPDPPARPVAIVGAGASGLAMARMLDGLGIPFTVLEADAEVGGTWRRNRYPGAAVDTPNHAYSFSFGERADWSRWFSPQPEIERYLLERSHEFGVRDRIRFRTRVTRCDWAGDHWRLALETPEGPEVLEAFALVSAIGPLSDVRRARFEGEAAFAGRLFHSADWPADLDLSGRRVAVIGTGASALQIVPAIVDRVAALTVHQRTPQWVREIPRLLEPMTDGARYLLRRVPFYAEWLRFTMLWRYGDGLLRTLRRDPDWPHPERAMNRVNDRHRAEMEAHVRRELEGRPDLIEKCLPAYPPYGKRMLLDNGWYRALRREHVELVTEPIARVTREGIETADGRLRPQDVIVVATGFDVTRFAARLNVTGRDGRRLEAEWAGEDPRAHLGVTVPGFPNLFVLQGPNTGLAHGGSAIFQAECQARYTALCLMEMLARGWTSLEVRREAHDAYVAKVDAEHAELVWAHPGVNTYYRNAAGRVVSVMPWRLVDYWGMTRTPDFSDYAAA